MAAPLSGPMKRYQDIADSIFGYFELSLQGDGTSTFQNYRSTVTDANVGPLDEELWKILEKMNGQAGGKRNYKKTRKLRNRK